MSSFNKVILLGNLTRDPELRLTPSGKALCTFALAVNRRSGSGAGAREEVLFINCEAWERSAENISKYTKKGSSILVEGHLKLDQWEDKTTKEKRSQIKVVVGSFQFMSKAPEGAAGGPGGAPIHDKPNAGGSYSTRFTPKPSGQAPQENLDEDVPF